MADDVVTDRRVWYIIYFVCVCVCVCACARAHIKKIYIYVRAYVYNICNVHWCVRGGGGGGREGGGERGGTGRGRFGEWNIIGASFHADSTEARRPHLAGCMDSVRPGNAAY